MKRALLLSVVLLAVAALIVVLYLRSHRTSCRKSHAFGAYALRRRNWRKSDSRPRVA